MNELTTQPTALLTAEQTFIETRLRAAEAMADTARTAVDYAKVARELRHECASDAQFHARLVQLGAQLQPKETDKLLRFAAKVEHVGVAIFLNRSTAVQSQVDMGLLPERSDTGATTKTPKARKPSDAIRALSKAIETMRDVIASTPWDQWDGEERRLWAGMVAELAKANAENK